MNSLMARSKKANIFPKTKKIILESIISIFNLKQMVSERIRQYDIIYVYYDKYRDWKNWKYTENLTDNQVLPLKYSTLSVNLQNT